MDFDREKLLSHLTVALLKLLEIRDCLPKSMLCQPDAGVALMYIIQHLEPSCAAHSTVCCVLYTAVAAEYKSQASSIVAI